MKRQITSAPANEITRPVPAIVLAAGDFTTRLAGQIQNIYLRGDERRQYITGFYALKQDDDGGPVIETCSHYSETTSADFLDEGTPVPTHLEKRQDALLAAVRHAPEIKARIEELLYTLRVHERLISAGWADTYHVPVNIFLLADLTDPWSAGTLLPLVAILNEIVSSKSLCQVNLLLRTAVFPQGPVDPKDDLRLAVFTLLRELDEILRLESDKRKLLVEALGYSNDNPPACVVYLFDSCKEGSTVVKDIHRLGVQMGNALLSLMQSDLARRLPASHDDFEVLEQGSYYNSIGAAGIIYDPESLQHAAASRLGAEFLSESILGEPLDDQAVIQIAHLTVEQLGDLGDWLETLVHQLSPEVGQVRIQPDTLEILVLLTGLIMEALDYEHIQSTAWVQQFQEYDQRLLELVFPEIQAKIQSNDARLQDQLVDELAGAVDRFPVQASLYPAGIQNAHKVLTLLASELKKEYDKLEKLSLRHKEKHSRIDGELAERYARLQAIIDAAPPLPRLIRILPRFLRSWLALLFYLRYYALQLHTAQALRDECVSLLQKKYALHIQLEAFTHLLSIKLALEEVLQQASTDYEKFESNLEQASQAFSIEWEEFPLGQLENSWDEIYRIPAVDRSLAEWAYAKWHPDLDAWVYEFLAETHLTTAWRKTSPEHVVDWVASRALKTFAPLWGLCLDEVFGLWLEGESGFHPKDVLSKETIATLMNATSPLLRPDFDAVGGSRLSYITFHALIGDPDWQYLRLPASASKSSPWQSVYTGDPYAASFIQVRNVAPLASLVEVVEPAQTLLEQLPIEKRLAFDLINGLDSSIRCPETEKKLNPHPSPRQ